MLLRAICGYILAIALMAIPSARNFRIVLTSSHVSLARPCSSPLLCLARFLFSISWILSVCVPRKRWSGFTQNPLSHLWQTHILGGISPRKIIHAARWASCGLPANAKFPYRLWLPTAPFHKWHPFGPCISTLAKNRSFADSGFDLSYWLQRMGYYSYIVKEKSN